MSNLLRCEKILTSLIRFLSMLCRFPIPSLGNGRCSSCPKFTQAKLRFANTCEKTTKSSSIKFKNKNKRNKPRISKDSDTSEIRTYDLVIKSLTHY